MERNGNNTGYGKEVSKNKKSVSKWNKRRKMKKKMRKKRRKNYWLMSFSLHNIFVLFLSTMFCIIFIF